MTQHFQRRQHCKLYNHTYNVRHKRNPLSHRENMMNLHGISGGPPRKSIKGYKKYKQSLGGEGEEREELKKNIRQTTKTVGKKTEYLLQQ